MFCTMSEKVKVIDCKLKEKYANVKLQQKHERAEFIDSGW